MSKTPTLSSVSCLKTAREHSLISELSHGTPEPKIAPKWTLEGARRTRNTRVREIELQDIDIELCGVSELQILTELRQNISTEYFWRFGGSNTDTRNVYL